MSRSSAQLLKAAAFGAVVGSRSMLVPALLSRTTRAATASRVWSLLAALEVAADKTPWIPSRTAPLSLAGRMAMGAATAFAMSSSRWRRSRSSRAAGALVAAASAAASAFLLRVLRVRLAARSRAANLLGGVLEDFAAFGAGRALVR